MLGIRAKTSYRTIQDFQTASDYLSYLYGDVKGYTAKCRISHKDSFYTEFYSTSNIVTTAFSGVLDAYVSMNTFFFKGKEIRREQKNLKRLNTCYVDIDCYKVNRTKESVLCELEEDYFGSKIPYPTFIIDSGRGLYLIYKLRNEDRNAFPRWNRVQKYLVEQCLPLGADSSCTDAARILRVPFSINSKSNTAVKILDFSDLTYSIYDIQAEYGIKYAGEKTAPKKEKAGVVYPYGEATQKMRDYASILSEKHGVDLPDFKDYHKTQEFLATYSGKKNPKRNKVTSFHAHNAYREKNQSRKEEVLKARIRDLECLFSMRKGEDCKREVGLFLYRLWMQELIGDAEEALQKTKEFNATFDVPLNEKYVTTRTYSAEKKLKDGETYLYSAKKIKQVLEITKEELKELHSLTKISKKTSNRKAYLTRLKKEGKITKKELVANRRKQISELLKQGMDRKEICRILEISRATYQRDIAVVKATVKPQERPVNEESTEEIKSNVEERKIEIQAVQTTQNEQGNKQAKRKQENQKGTDKTDRNSLFSCCIKNSAPILKKALRRSAAGVFPLWHYGVYDFYFPP